MRTKEGAKEIAIVKRLGLDPERPDFEKLRGKLLQKNLRAEDLPRLSVVAILAMFEAENNSAGGSVGPTQAHKEPMPTNNSPEAIVARAKREWEARKEKHAEDERTRQRKAKLRAALEGVWDFAPGRMVEELGRAVRDEEFWDFWPRQIMRLGETLKDLGVESCLDRIQPGDDEKAYALVILRTAVDGTLAQVEQLLDEGVRPFIPLDEEAWTVPAPPFSPGRWFRSSCHDEFREEIMNAAFPIAQQASQTDYSPNQPSHFVPEGIDPTDDKAGRRAAMDCLNAVGQILRTARETAAGAIVSDHAVIFCVHALDSAFQTGSYYHNCSRMFGGICAEAVDLAKSVRSSIRAAVRKFRELPTAPLTGWISLWDIYKERFGSEIGPNWSDAISRVEKVEVDDKGLLNRARIFLPPEAVEHPWHRDAWPSVWEALARYSDQKVMQLVGALIEEEKATPPVAAPCPSPDTAGQGNNKAHALADFIDKCGTKRRQLLRYLHHDGQPMQRKIAEATRHVYGKDNPNNRSKLTDLKKEANKQLAGYGLPYEISTKGETIALRKTDAEITGEK